MSYFGKLPEAVASSTKPWFAEPGSTKTNPIMIDGESSTKADLGARRQILL
ncbi:hypothetical protein PENDEC_c078G00553 [Penicillium decumbens]|uniref:Uncharacterized protein n=1 Tax=Penicillium decumbens TaxID=69771 RepID=A0A1V6NLY2_PENDC|nr:hypothetical protein PENDEC_c078G00553 [Penicillium decumbens]